MPLPQPQNLTLKEAAAFVAARCRCPEPEAREAIERAIREWTLKAWGHRKDGRSEIITERMLEQHRFYWDRGVFQYRSAATGIWDDLLDVYLDRWSVEWWLKSSAERETIDATSTGDGAVAPPADEAVDVRNRRWLAKFRDLKKNNRAMTHEEIYSRISEADYETPTYAARVKKAINTLISAEKKSAAAVVDIATASRTKRPVS
jgi:hypothetical protein